MSSTNRTRRRRTIRRRQLANDPHCWFCGYTLTLETSSLDHIKPTTRGGTDAEENFVLSCRRCNVTKADRPMIGLAVCRVRTFGVLTERRLRAIRAQHQETIPISDPAPQKPPATADTPPTD